MNYQVTRVAFALALALPNAAAAQDVKFVGTWEGFSQPVYTKLVFHGDGSLTYCSVQNCRAIQCDKRDYSGSIGQSIAFADELREWSFEWTKPDEIEALMSVRDGGMGFAVYTPEGPEDRFDVLSLPDPMN